MAQSSSFTPLEVIAPGPQGEWRTAFLSALDGAAFTIPLSLGSVMLIYRGLGLDLTAAGVMATLLCLAAIQLTTAGSQRPLLYSARFFEATTLAAMVAKAGEQMHAWGIADSPASRVAVLCLIVAGAGIVVGLLYASRADRFSRHVPSAVFAGFSNSIAITLILSQSRMVSDLATRSRSGMVGALAIAGAAFVAGVAVRRWLPRWPAAATALAAGFAIGALFTLAGGEVDTLGKAAHPFALPVAYAHFSALMADGVDGFALAGWLAINAAILGLMVFINTTITAQAMSHADDRPADTPKRMLWVSACIAMAGITGSAPLSGSLQSCSAATRTARLSAPVLLCSAAVLAAVGASGLLAWMPLAAVAGALLCEGVFMFDRRSMKLLRQWLGRASLNRQVMEDLALIAAVTLAGVAMNMVAAVVTGLLLGMLLFASRHMQPPVRAVWDGTQLASNCARSRNDLQALADHGSAMRVVELEGDVFFGTMDVLDRSLRKAIEDASCLVLDWSSVRHVDASGAQAVQKFQTRAAASGVKTVHVDPGANRELSSVLAPVFEGHLVAPDLDHALEHAENHVLQTRSLGTADDATSMLDAMTLFAGMDDGERRLLESRMTQNVVHAGDPVMRAGEPGDGLMLVLEGSASVVVRGDAGQQVRVAGLRRGAIIGELAFLDRAPRSATVVARDEMVVAVLDRAAYDRLSLEAPTVVQKLLANLAVYLATRLRRTTRMAAARQGRGRA